MAGGRYASCLLPQAVGRELTYLVPPELAATAVPGARVEVPLRGGRAIALVTRLDDAAPAGVTAKPLAKVLDPVPFFDGPALAFLKWVGEYYLAPAGAVLRAALPETARRVRKREHAAASPEPAAAGNRSIPPALSGAQQRALDAIVAAMHAGRYTPFLLHGVTGSGKTEVYLRAAADALDRGRSVLLLVPEITLAHQIVGWVTARFGDRVSVLHSRLTGAERARALEEVRHGPRLLVGARSAIFAPLHDLGLIVVDEEHEGAYKQEESAPLYHARECALMRGKLAGCPVVLGSATPSIETAARARQGQVTLLELPDRVDRTPLPAVEVVSMAREPKGAVIGGPLAAALQETVGRGEQALLFLNRRGFAPVLLCVACGHVAKCKACSTNLVFHAHDAALKCHWCGTSAPYVNRCADCGGEVMRGLGIGTQKVEAEARALLPQARIVRMDQDTTRGRTSHKDLLGAFADGDILIGTQMVAKGLDFPRLTLVGVILADLSLDLPDFRAAERTFQLLTQVAGRAGRRETRGRVMIQAFAVDHPAILAAADHDYWRHFAAETAARKALGYPPYGKLVRIKLAGKKEAEVEAVAKRLAARLTAGLPPKAAVLGPAPAFPALLAGTHRRHLVVKGPTAANLRGLVSQALGATPDPRVRITVDVDPLNVLS